MDILLKPPVPPMLAKRVEAIPKDGSWIFEPKWDGFRSIIFRDKDEVFIQSRDGKPLNRYFPELIDPLRQQLPLRCVLDGEIVIATPQGLDFDALQLRLHPAESRVKLLAKQTPASVVFFDLLYEDHKDLMSEPFAKRRSLLEKVLRSAKPPLHITPSTTEPSTAEDWFQRFEGAGLDGVIAKAAEGQYEPDKRVMLKLKHEHDCDCVVAGFRWHKAATDAVGSLLLGLYDNQDNLQHVGVCANFAMLKRRELVKLLTPYRRNALKGHPWVSSEEQRNNSRMPGGQSRWSQGKDLSWEPLRPELVVEVAYDHMQGDRFRHTAQFRRWRKDKAPADCTYAQLETVPPQELSEIFASGR